jgi:hypothetical protein
LKDYVEELGRRGVFDQMDSDMEEKIYQGGPESLESEEDDSDIVELEDSESEGSDLDPVTMNDLPDQVAESTVPKASLLPRSTSIQLPSTSIPQDQPCSKSESVRILPVTARPVHVEEVLDENFLPGTHPNCFIDEASNTPEDEIQQATPTFSADPKPPLDEMLEQANDGKSPPQDVSERQDLGKEDSIYGRRIPRITFKDPSGRSWVFPLLTVKTWDVSKLILWIFLKPLRNYTGFDKSHFKSFSRCRVARDFYAKNAGYDLIGPEGMLVLPEIWPDLVQPGWPVSLQPRNLLQEHPQQSHRAISRHPMPHVPLNSKALPRHSKERGAMSNRSINETAEGTSDGLSGVRAHSENPFETNDENMSKDSEDRSSAIYGGRYYPEDG